MASHVSDLAAAKIPEHIPAQAIRAWTSREVLGVVGMVRSWSDPKIVVQVRWWVTGSRKIAIAP